MLSLGRNQLTRIDADTFRSLTKLTTLNLDVNPLSSIETGAFRGLVNLSELSLANDTLTELNLADADFSSLTGFTLALPSLMYEGGSNSNITSVSLRNIVTNQTSFTALLLGGDAADLCHFGCAGIGDIPGITKLDLSGIDFVDISDLEPLYAMDDLTDLWLVNIQNMAAADLDGLLDNLETIEGTDAEGILYMTQANFDAFNSSGGGLLAAWNAEPGHHVVFVVPEPSTLLLGALATLGLLMRRGW